MKSCLKIHFLLEICSYDLKRNIYKKNKKLSSTLWSLVNSLEKRSFAWKKNAFLEFFFYPLHLVIIKVKEVFSLQYIIPLL